MVAWLIRIATATSAKSGVRRARRNVVLRADHVIFVYKLTRNLFGAPRRSRIAARPGTAILLPLPGCSSRRTRLGGRVAASLYFLERALMAIKPAPVVCRHQLRSGMI